MESKEYLKNKLNEISNIFPELTFRYQFNENTLTHIIEVKPLEDYQTNNEYIKHEAELMFNFENEFFPETILFVSEDSLTQITKSEFIIGKGREFTNPGTTSNYSFLFDLQESFLIANDCDYALAA